MTEKEYEEWYNDCKYIKSEMFFSTYKMFIWRAYEIRQKFVKANEFVRVFYKWFVYANNDMTINQKNNIWRYLNGDMDYLDLFN